MGTITFPEAQVRSITEQIITLPIIINGVPATGQTGLVDALAAANESKANNLKRDEDNTVFYDNAKLTVDTYHGEIIPLTGETRTNYNTADLISSASHDLPHYDKTTWFNAVIQIIASNNGNPRTGSPNGENTQAPNALSVLNDYLNGYSSSAPIVGAELAADYTVGDTQIELDLTGGQVGDYLFITDGTKAMILEITDITNAPIYDTIALANEDNFLTADSATTEFTAFSDAQRGRQVALTAEELSLLTGFEQLVNDALTPLLALWTAQSTALATQISSGDNTKVTENTDAKGLVDDVIFDYNAWLSTPITDPAGRFTDASIIPLIQTNLQDRVNTEIPARTSDINTFLGSVSQTPDGAVSGSGAYLNLTNLIKARADLISGSLANFLQSDNTINAIQADIDQKNADLARFESFFAVGQIASDTQLGQIEFDVLDASEFSAGQAVSVFDSASVVFTRNIDTIVGNRIRLDSGIPAVLTAANLARIIREK